ncbi:hypothetical protein EJB05_14882, partial [Eragrostis curvula]
MAVSGQSAHLWKEWGVQVLVLVSFALHVILIILAEFRRRVDSGFLRFFTWSAYQLADATVIYVLGHMSVTSQSPEHELVALWAPFLLMHLGGQDNITAYAVEDSRLWLRHLQTLAVQVAAAAYVICASSILGSQPLLRVATVLLFLVGAVKYGERVWTLRCGSGSALGNNYRDSGSLITTIKFHYISHPSADRSATEDIIFLGHKMLDVPKDFIKGPIPYELAFRFKQEVEDEDEDHRNRVFRLPGMQAYRVAELQVSLMQDVYFTKAESQCGWIRIVSSAATAVALSLLFTPSPVQNSCPKRHEFPNGGSILLSSTPSDRSHIAGYNKVDVVITYVLLVGAAILEATSLVRYILSSFSWFRYEKNKEEAACNHVSPSARPCSRLESKAQLVPLHGAAQLAQARPTGVAGWQEGWESRTGGTRWLPHGPSPSHRSSIEQLVVNQVLESRGVPETSPDHILNSRGRAVLKRKGQQFYNDLNSSVHFDILSMDESILVWHIATDLYLRWYKKNQPKGASSISWQDDHLAEAVEALPNYMLFLVAARPHMLSPPANRNAYVEICYNLTAFWDLADRLRGYGDPSSSWFHYPYPMYAVMGGPKYLHTTALEGGSGLAAKLIAGDSPPAYTLELIGKVWAELLCYAGNRCSAYSHTKQLSDGSELITVAAFLVEYLKRDVLKANTDSEGTSSESE